MARLVLAAAGAVVGGLVGGTTGAQIGWTLGSLIGGTFEPAKKTAGPRLGDLSVSGSAYGTPIPYVAGSPRVAGQIIWASTKRELSNTQHQGKGGGGGTDYTEYSYEIDLLLLLTDNPITGVLRIWNNGALIWSSASNAAATTLAASSVTTRWARMTVYTGAASQLADPTYEAAVGTANAPAYRGRGTVFIQSLQLGSSGMLPNLTFEVCTTGSAGVTDLQYNNGGTLSNGTRDYVYSSGSASFGAIYLRSSTPRSGRWYIEYVITQTLTGRGFHFGMIPRSKWTGSQYPANPYTTAQGYVVTNTNYYGCAPGIVIDGAIPTLTVEFNEVWGVGSIFGVAVDYDTRKVWICKNGVWFGGGSPGIDDAYPTFNLPSADFDPFAAVYLQPGYGAYGMNASLYEGEATYQPAGFAMYSIPVLANAPPTVQTVVGALCELSGLTGAQYSATALSSISTPVRALAVGQVSNVRNVIDILGQAHNFDAVLSDKLYFRLRGASVARSIPFEDLGCDGGEPVALRMVNELEVPAQLALSYANIDNDHQADTQYSDRLISSQASTATVELPLSLYASEAKAMADAQLMDKAIGMTSTSLAVPVKYAALEPCDVVSVTDEDANAWRMRIVKKSEADGIIKFDVVMDDATVFTQAGTTTAGSQGQSVVYAPPTSSLLLLDIPLLADADNAPGHYAAIKIYGESATSAGLYRSAADNGYTLNQTVLNSATTGIATTALTTWAGRMVWDEVSTVTVSIGLGQLSSATRDAVLNDRTVNAAVIGAELVQFRTATLVSTGVYTLSGFLRGRLGTEWAMSGHAAGEDFCLLGYAGMMMVPMASGDLGKLWYYKAVTAGQAVSTAAYRTLTPVGILLKPYSPVDCRVNRVTTDTAIAWKRRTRLQPRFVGTLGINVPLGEATEAYEVEVYSSAAFTVLKRTITGLATPAATYTSAQQVTDFGSNQSVLYLKIYQISATVGRGYPLTVTV